MPNKRQIPLYPSTKQSSSALEMKLVFATFLETLANYIFNILKHLFSMCSQSYTNLITLADSLYQPSPVLHRKLQPDPRQHIDTNHPTTFCLCQRYIASPNIEGPNRHRFTMDVKSLYTCITHADGSQALQFFSINALNKPHLPILYFV